MTAKSIKALSAGILVGTAVLFRWRSGRAPGGARSAWPELAGDFAL
ncbi:MAG TPA: hypothetical protein VGE68_04825 [Sphingomicrobium sp.]